MPLVANPAQKSERKARILLGNKAGMRTKILRDMPEVRTPPHHRVPRIEQRARDHRVAKRPHVAIDPRNRFTHVDYPCRHRPKLKLSSSDADRAGIRPTYPAACED